MSESSPEKKSEAAEPVAPQKTSEDKTVPVAALAKERAEKRAAKAEADELRQERDGNQKDMQALIEAMGPYVADLVTKATEAAVKPMKDEATKLKTAMALGLNEAQSTALDKLKSESPGLSDQRALTILKMEQPDLFPRRANPVTGIVPAGISEVRNQPQAEDFMAKMNEAKKNGDPALAQDYAKKELFRRFTVARMKLK